MEAIEFPRRRTKCTYKAIISQAILCSPQKKLTLAEIYQVIKNYFPGFIAMRSNWKNTVRHNLSLHECFVKEPNLIRRKGYHWRVRQEQETQQFERFINDYETTSLQTEKTKDYETFEDGSYTSELSKRMLLEYDARKSLLWKYYDEEERAHSRMLPSSFCCQCQDDFSPYTCTPAVEFEGAY